MLLDKIQWRAYSANQLRNPGFQYRAFSTGLSVGADVRSGNTANYNVPFIINEQNVFRTFARKTNTISWYFKTAPRTPREVEVSPIPHNRAASRCELISRKGTAQLLLSKFAGAGWFRPSMYAWWFPSNAWPLRQTSRARPRHLPAGATSRTKSARRRRAKALSLVWSERRNCLRSRRTNT